LGYRKGDLMFDYTILPYADDRVFGNALNLFESKFPSFKKEELLVDVDDSSVQIYIYNNKKIKFYNDYEVDAIYVKSDIDLSELDFKTILN
jgi:hypothetical protein